MKNQYFGDERDFIKYSLLRHLAASDLKLMVAWMLTPDDGSTDGRHIGYLERPDRWRDRDPVVFDFLERTVVRERRRHVAAVETSGLFGKATFFDEVLRDPAPLRRRYMHELLEASRGRDLVFFDADVGIEVPSAKYGTKRSSRYLYRHELDAFYDRGLSLLIYQHFPREPHDAFTRRMNDRLIEATGSERVVSIKRGHVVFFLVPHKKHEDRLLGVPEGLRSGWSGLLTIGLQTAGRLPAAGNLAQGPLCVDSAGRSAKPARDRGAVAVPARHTGRPTRH